MTLQDQMSGDLTSTFLQTGDFAVSGTYYPRGSATGFTVTLAVGDPNPATIQILQGDESRREVKLLGKRTTLRTGIATALSAAARDPQRGDSFVIASGADAGTWVVQNVVCDAGDGAQMDAVLSDLRGPGHQTSREVR